MTYLDHAATTPVKDEVLEVMLPYFSKNFANASSGYAAARDSRKAIDTARHQVAQAIGAKASEIYFTSGGSESDNWAMMGVAAAQPEKKHIVTTKIEHHAVLHTCKALENGGYEVDYLDVDECGRVYPESLDRAIRSDTLIASIMLANNEVGTIEPVAMLAEIAHQHGTLMHTDAVQAVGHIPVDVSALGVDLLSMSAHKFGGPKGCGALYVKSGVRIDPMIFGGAQERNMRAGTENVPAIVGMAVALEDACENMDANNKKVIALRDKLIAGLSQIPHCALNGDPNNRLPGNVSFCFEGIEGESLLLLLDAQGICASSGSACTSGSLDPSHVLLAIGRVHDVAHGSLRLSVCHENTEEEIDHILTAVPQVVSLLRNMSPVWRDLQNGKREYIL